jgi:hypothetical protein
MRLRILLGERQKPAHDLRAAGLLLNGPFSLWGNHFAADVSYALPRHR